MADKKVSDLPSLNGADVDPADLLYIVDSSAGAAGSKKITVGQYQLAPVSGGTANTVVYLNGTKVQTGSSALTFDGTNLGIGTSSPAQKLHVNNTTNVNTYAAFSNSNATNGNYVGTAANGDGIIGTIDAKPLLFLTGAATRATLDSSGNLGLGVAPVAYTANARTFQLDGGANSAQIRLTNNTTGTAQTNGGLLSMDGNQLSVWNVENDVLRFGTNDTERARITSGGDLQAYGAVSLWPSSSGGAGSYSIKRAATNALTINDDFAGQERLRITSGGEVVVNETAAVAGAAFSSNAFSGTAAAGFKSNASTVYAIVTIWGNETSGNQIFTRFATDANQERGTIAYNRAGGLVAYNTTSDYRAKDIIGPVQNAGATIDALKVYEGVMKGATQSRPMLIAHEAQEHAPYAVSGIKDEVNEDGTPKFQQMDVSSLVPLLLAEIQSLRARVAALEAK